MPFVFLLSILVALALLLCLDARSWSLLRNSLFLAGATCALSLPLDTVLAWLLVRTDLPGRKFGLGVLGILLFVPLYLQAAAWRAGFGLQGWYQMAWQGPVLLEGWTGAVFIHVMAALPWVTLIVGAGLWLVEPELEEQALLDASPMQVFLRVTLRAALPAIGVAALWVAIVTLGEMTVTDLFSVRTYAEEIYTTFAMGGDPEGPPLPVLPGVVLVAGLAVASLMLAARWTRDSRPLSRRPRWIFCLGAWRWPAALAVGLVLVLVAGVPLVNLCYKAGGMVIASGAGPVRSWSPVKCLTMVATSPMRYRREFGWSLTLGILSASAAVLAGAGLAWFGRRGRGRMLAMLMVVAVCMAVPGPVLGLAIIGLLNRPEPHVLGYLYDQTILAPWLALVIRGLAPATLVLWHALRTIPPEVLDSAAVDGAGPWTRFWRIGLASRLSAPGLAWLVVLALALGDLAATVLVVPPGMFTLSVRIFDLLHSGVQDQVAGICLALVLGFTALACGMTAIIIAITARGLWNPDR